MNKSDKILKMQKNLNNVIFVEIAGFAINAVFNFKEQFRDACRLLGLTAGKKKGGAVSAQADMSPEKLHDLHMRISMTNWTDSDAVCLCTQRRSFTIGNAPEFDIYLDPTKYSVGEVYCTVFFDKGINSYVFMLVSGGFNVPVKETDEPYLPGDRSLFDMGNREQTDMHNAIRVPVSDPDDPVHVRFNIGNTYYFEAWCHDVEQAPVNVDADAAPAEDPAKPDDAVPAEAPPTEAPPAETPAAPAFEVPVVNLTADTPVATAPADTPVATAPVDTPVATTPVDAPVATAPTETVVASAPVDTPVVSTLKDAPDIASVITAAVSGASATRVFNAPGEDVKTKVYDASSNNAPRADMPVQSQKYDTAYEPDSIPAKEDAFAANFPTVDAYDEPAVQENVPVPAMVTVPAEEDAFAANFPTVAEEDPEQTDDASDATADDESV